MGIVRDRQIDATLREVEAMATLLQAVNRSLSALEERVKALENGKQVAHRLDRRERKPG